MYIKSLTVRYFLIFILFVIGPPLLLAGGLIAGILSYPLLPLIFMCNDGYRWCRCCENKCCKVTGYIFLCLSMYIVFAIMGAFATVAAALLFVLFYIVSILLALRMFFVQCCKSKKVQNSKKEKIDMMVEQRK